MSRHHKDEINTKIGERTSSLLLFTTLYLQATLSLEPPKALGGPGTMVLHLFTGDGLLVLQACNM